MGRHQTGYIFGSKSGAFHVRYNTTEIVGGQPRRVQKSHLLCRKDSKHFSKLEGTTKEKFIHILSGATPDVQARILQGILERYPVDSIPIRTKKLHDEIVGWIRRLSTGAVVAVTPLRVTSAVVERALLDAEKLMASTGATSGVDRAHTALHGYLLQACSDRSIVTGSRP